MSVQNLTEDYSVRTTTVYDLKKQKEADVKEMLHIDNDVPFVHSLSDEKIVNILLNTKKTIIITMVTL